MFRNTCAYEGPEPGEKDLGVGVSPASRPQTWEMPFLCPRAGWVGWTAARGAGRQATVPEPTGMQGLQPRPGRWLAVWEGLLALSRCPCCAGLIRRPHASLPVQ